MLNFIIDNKRANELASLKQAMAQHNWLEWKMVMEKKYNLLIENGTWELIDSPSRANVITEK